MAKFTVAQCNGVRCSLTKKLLPVGFIWARCLSYAPMALSPSPRSGYVVDKLCFNRVMCNTRPCVSTWSCRNRQASETREADIILPSQYFGTMGSSGLSGEQRPMLAVLTDAIDVLQSWRGGKNAQQRRNFAEAAHWVNNHGTSNTFSFDIRHQVFTAPAGVVWLADGRLLLALGRKW
jgi:hypothetical protein